MPEEQETDLEKVLKEKVKPLLDEAMQKFLGITVSEIESDISDKLKQPLLDFEVDTGVSFKSAKKQFKRQYLIKLLQQHWGNVSKVADLADVDRRSIHRLVQQLGIDVNKMRKEMMKREYLRREAVKDIIEKTLETYKGALAPESMKKMYEEVPSITKEIVKEIPEVTMTLKKAEQEFEKRYLKQALKENKKDTAKTAKAVGLRYETLHRKLKELGL